MKFEITNNHNISVIFRQFVLKPPEGKPRAAAVSFHAAENVAEANNGDNMQSYQDDIWIILREGTEGLSVKISPIANLNDLLIARNYSEELVALVQNKSSLVDVILEVSYN
jgi:hypothetical protein